MIAKQLSLILILLSFGACASWQENTRMGITIATQAAKAAETETQKYYDEKCSSLQEQIDTEDVDCYVDNPPKICKELEECLNGFLIAEKAFTTFYQTAKMTLVAITLGDKQSALSYAEKSLQMVKDLYKMLQTLLPDKLPSLPFLNEIKTTEE